MEETTNTPDINTPPLPGQARPVEGNTFNQTGSEAAFTLSQIEEITGEPYRHTYMEWESSPNPDYYNISVDDALALTGVRADMQHHPGKRMPHYVEQAKYQLTRPDRVPYGWDAASSIDNEEDIRAFIISKESGGRYNAENPESSAYGKYQLLDSTTRTMAKRMGVSVKEMKDPDMQEKAFNLLLEEYKRNLTENFHMPINRVNVYTIHQLGYNRAKEYFEGKLSKGLINAMWKNLGNDTKIIQHSDKEAIYKAWTKRYRTLKTRDVR